MNDEKQMLQELKQLEQGDAGIHVELSACQAWLLVAALQLACRHPGFLGEARATAERVGHWLQDALARHAPATGRILERGWHEVFDVPSAAPAATSTEEKPQAS